MAAHHDGTAPNNFAAELTFCPAHKLSFNPRPQMARLFVDGFSQWLHYFSKDPHKLAAAFEPAFQLETFYVAVTGKDTVVAMVGCPENAPALVLESQIFRKALGNYKGLIAYQVLKKFLVDNHYPFPVTLGMGSIEFVVSDRKVWGLGVTRRLLAYVMHHRAYTCYVLEVASTNIRALKLYESLGFTEFMRKPASRRSGVGDYLYLKTRRKRTLRTYALEMQSVAQLIG